MKTSTLILAAMTMAGSLLTAKEAPHAAPPVPPDVLAKYDTNSDGKLDATELAAMKADLEAQRKALIAKYDTNGDGVLNATERAAMQADLEAQHVAELKAKFTALDTDISGGLSLAEFTVGAPTGATPAQVQAAFNRLDKNKDSSISLDEFLAPHVDKPDRRLADLKAKFTQLDTDASSGLSLAEFTAGAPAGATADKIQAAFTRFDTNADSSISLDEFVAGLSGKHDAGHKGPPHK